MINHIRTLLLNQSAASRPEPTFPGEEVVPPNFIPRRLTPGMQHLWHCLFGRQPDALYQNYRLWQIMALLHASPLADLVTLRDSRITYQPQQYVAFPDCFRVDVTQIAGAPVSLYVFGEPAADDVAGICMFSWRVDYLAPSTLRIIAQFPAAREITAEVTFSAGLSSAVPIRNTPLQLRVAQAAENCSWTVNATGRPYRPFGEVLAAFAQTLQDDGRAAIFKEPRTELYERLYRAWQDYPTDIGRYSAAILGLAYRIEEQPNATS